MRMHNPAHPGEVLRDISEGRHQGNIAARLGITRQTLSRIMNGHASITAPMALRLAKEFPASTPELWLKLQMQYDLWQAMHVTPTPTLRARRQLPRKVAVRRAA